MNGFQVRLSVTLLILTLASIGAYVHLEDRKPVKMHSLPDGLTEFNVADPIPICAQWRQHMPRARDPDTYRLYMGARKLWRSKIEWQLTRSEGERILIDVGLAAEKGDWGARSLMSYFYLHGLGPLDKNKVLSSDPRKSVEIVRSGVAAGQPWAFYDLGVAHEHGYGGAANDSTIAWAYYLRAAQLGNPDAQMALAQAYRENGQPDKANAMIQCAYKQDHGPAAYKLGIRASNARRYDEALRLFQQGTKFGHKESAAALLLFFMEENWSTGHPDDIKALNALNLRPDPERVRRYKIIEAALQVNPDLRPTRLDNVLPLPPAELPAWNGVSDALEPESSAPPTY